MLQQRNGRLTSSGRPVFLGASSSGQRASTIRASQGQRHGGQVNENPSSRVSESVAGRFVMGTEGPAIPTIAEPGTLAPMQPAGLYLRGMSV